MYAHVNIWPMNQAGATSEDASAREVAGRLRQKPGFLSYTLIRTGQQEVVAVTVFQSERQLEDALKSVADVVRQRVDPLAAGEPIRREGEVLYQVVAEQAVA